MKILALRAQISPTSAAEHIVPSLILTAWNIRGIRRSQRSSRQVSPQVMQQIPT